MHSGQKLFTTAALGKFEMTAPAEMVLNRRSGESVTFMSYLHGVESCICTNSDGAKAVYYVSELNSSSPQPYAEKLGSNAPESAQAEDGQPELFTMKNPKPGKKM